MATQSWLLIVSVLVEQDEETLLHEGGGRTDDEIRKAVAEAIAALYAEKCDTTVEWQSMTSVPLDGKPATGRCAVCNCWMYDVENCTDFTPTRISRGAVVDGRYLCDVHLPPDHPLAF